MGYVTKDIADITEPHIVSLAGEDNFLIIASKSDIQQQSLRMSFRLTGLTTAGTAIITITDYAGGLHTFTSTRTASAAGGNVFYAGADITEDIRAENIRQALLSDSWLAANFNIVIPLVWSPSGVPSNGNVIYIESRGTDSSYAMTMTLSGSGATWSRTYISSLIDGDTISNGQPTQIELEFYENTGVFLGGDDRGSSIYNIGDPFAESIKTYAGDPIWFNVNALFKRMSIYNRPPVSGWGDAGTIKDFRFTIKRITAANSVVFYQSNVLYVLNGFGRTLERLDLKPYTFGLADGLFKPLTNQPRNPYTYGQPAYFNFIFSDDQRGIPNPSNYTVRLLYTAYSQSGELLGTMYSNEIARASLAMVNTCALDIDTVLDTYPLAGEVRVALARGNATVSEEIVYEIVPTCLHTLNCFSFLNRLGGWDCFNFDAAKSSKTTQKSETFRRTVTPYMSQGDSVETVYRKTLEKPYTVEGVIVSDAVAEWLDEFAGSKVILDPEGNYVILEDFTIEVDPDSPELQTVTMRYRLTETLNNE